MSRGQLLASGIGQALQIPHFPEPPRATIFLDPVAASTALGQRKKMAGAAALRPFKKTSERSRLDRGLIRERARLVAYTL